MKILPLHYFLLLLLPCTAVDHSKFRTCNQTSFCAYHRATPSPPLRLLNHTLSFHTTLLSRIFHRVPILTGTLLSQCGELQLSVVPLEGGMLRVRIDESRARWAADDLVLEPIAVAPSQFTEVSPLIQRAKLDVPPENCIALEYGDMYALFTLAPFEFHVFRESGPPILSGSSIHFEAKSCHATTTTTKSDTVEESEDRHGGKEIAGYWEDGLAIYADGTREQRRATRDSSDSFGGHVDTSPNGAMSVGMEVVYHQSIHLFGIPEHASSTLLRPTNGENRYYEEPYRLYNLDVFEYDLDETMALYGNVPLVVSQGTVGTAGVFWFNPTETFVDVRVEEKEERSRTHFISESGVVDLFLIGGPTPELFYGQYAKLTGKMPLPPMFSLGYHQCRWNYRDEADVYFVHSKFEELDYPYDVLWLDIEHTDGKRYFTWDNKLFPNPEVMQKKLANDGRRMVTIVDPHIKIDPNYYIHKEATALGLYIKDKDGAKDYDGWCWPGSSSYLDFTSENVRKWWADQFSYNKYKGSTPDLFTWNDMNEPSVFNGPEVSMPKDLLNLDKIEHREWHNLYGMLFHRSTSEGLTKRNPGANIRPFVLSRSFFAGSQKYGAIWTGDNAAKWDHLEIATPMLLSLNVGALSFVGADVGGFFGDTDAELMTRWMQAGAFTPFFRGHAHHDSKRREPWVFGEETMVRLRRAAMARYALLPYWYTVFWHAGVTGMPVMRMMWMQYPKIPELYSVDNQYLIGTDLLVRPVTSAGAVSSEIKFPLSDCWYDVDSMQRIPMSGDPNTAATKVLKSDIDKIPVYQRGGSVIPRKLRLRRSSALMINDPYTLYIALDDNSGAEGTLYMDDETTFNHDKKGDYAVATFTSAWDESIAIKNSVRIGSEDGVHVRNKESRMVERIIVMGLPDAKSPRGIELFTGHVQGALPMEFQYDRSSRVLVIRKPGVSALEDWTMRLLF